MISSAPRVGGMLVGYYALYPHKAWLSLGGLWMEQEPGLSCPSATVVLDQLGDDSLFVTPVARSVIRGAEADPDAMDRAQAEIERWLREYDYEG